MTEEENHTETTSHHLINLSTAFDDVLVQRPVLLDQNRHFASTWMRFLHMEQTKNNKLRYMKCELL